MNSKASGAFILLGSIIVSCLLTHALTKAKYEKSSKPAPKPEPKKENDKANKNDEVVLQVTKEKDDVIRYADKYKKEHAEFVNRYAPTMEETPKREYIDQDTFSSRDDFEVVGFTLYSDGTVTDEDNVVITDLDSSVGRDAIERFDELERSGAVYVRNYETNTDFEIVRDLRTYSEALARRGHAVSA